MWDAEQLVHPSLVECECDYRRFTWVHRHIYTQLVHGESMELGLSSYSESHLLTDLECEFRRIELIPCRFRQGPC